MNKVIMMGRLTGDPTVNYANTGSTIGKFSLAVDRRFKREGQPEADFFNCVTFGKQAEFIEKYLHKGTKVVICGSLQNNHYTDKNGVAHYSEQILVEEINFAESKNAQGTQAPAQAQTPAENDFVSVPDGMMEDLPFN